MPDQSRFIEAMRKHLPPSASRLNVLDVGGVAQAVLAEGREDIVFTRASLYAASWDYPADSMDSVVAYDLLLSDEFLSAVLRVMRPGGRLIVVHPVGSVDETYVETLEKAGYTRILVEPAHGIEGVLIRGEIPHATADTLERVADVANADADLLDIETYRGRYVHLLIRQTPNKPVWRLAPDEKIEWRAAAIERHGTTYLLAFSSLPKSVSFMQPAVLENFLQDVNKVGKFRKQVATAWLHPVLLNPTLASVRDDVVVWVAMDAETAEAPDE